MLRQLVDRLPDEKAGSRRHDRILAVLFDYATGQTRVARGPDGQVMSRVSQPLADVILDLPLFPTRVGIPISAQRLIKEFCLEQNAGEAVSIVELVEEDIAAPLKRWKESFLTVERIEENPSESVPATDSEPTPGRSLAEMGAEEVCRVLSVWFRRLRPDEHVTQLARGAVPDHGEVTDGLLDRYHLDVRSIDPGDDVGAWQLEDMAARQLATSLGEDVPFVFTFSPRPLLIFNESHELFRQLGNSDVPESRRLAWVLLSMYAHINEVVSPVTNQHELEFQRRLAELVRRDELHAGGPES